MGEEGREERVESLGNEERANGEGEVMRRRDRMRRTAKRKRSSARTTRLAHPLNGLKSTLKKEGVIDRSGGRKAAMSSSVLCPVWQRKCFFLLGSSCSSCSSSSWAPSLHVHFINTHSVFQYWIDRVTIKEDTIIKAIHIRVMEGARKDRRHLEASL